MNGPRRKHRKARHQPASTKRKEEAVRAAKMTGWTKAHGQDDNQNNGGNPYPNEEFPPPSSTRRGGFRIFDVIFSKWQTLQLFERLYVLALVVLVAGLVVVRISSNPSYYVYGAAPLASLAYLVGFGLWIGPWIRRIWQFPLGKFVLAWSSAGIWVLALILTRMFVAEVLGLPPQDFEVTVRVWTLLFYLPIWIGVFYILTLIFALFAFISAGVLSLITSSSLVNIFATKARWKLVLDRFVLRSFGHAGGAFIFAAITAAGLTWYFSAITRLEPAIRLTAYYADYQIVPRYPGVDTTRRLRLHPNGVVSYAEKHGWDVLISVDKVQREVGQVPL